jgi:hypothetical protein
MLLEGAIIQPEGISESYVLRGEAPSILYIINPAA